MRFKQRVKRHPKIDMGAVDQIFTDVGNRDFLDAIFSDLLPDEYLWTAQFKTAPNQAKAEQWGGLPVTDLYQNRQSAHQGWNHYFSVAALKPAADGSKHRRKDTFSRLFCVVLDDAAAIPGIAPTWILETSHPEGGSKVQVGYRLAEPLADLNLAVALHKALTAAGHLGADRNGNNPVRYVRLPWGWNTKYDPPHQHRLLHWVPTHRVDLDTLIAALGLDLAADAPTATETTAAPAQPIAPAAFDGPDGWIPKGRRLAWDAARRTHDDPKVGRHQEIYKLGTFAARDGLPAEALEFILQEFVKTMRPTDSNGIVTGVNWDTERKTIKDGYRQGHADGVPAQVDLSGFLNSFGTARTRRADYFDHAAFEAATGMTIEEANRRAPDYQVIEDHAPGIKPFPVPGLDAVAAWITQCAPVSYPVITQQAVLAMVATAAARLYATPQGDPLSLYLGCSSRSVGEMRYATHAMQTVFGLAGLRRMIRGTRLASPAALYKTLQRSPAALYLSDDYGGVSAFSKRQPSGLQEHALFLLSSVYDGKTIQLDGPEDAGLRPGVAGDEQPIIYNPSLSILALTGADQLAVLMRASETGRGAFQQMLWAIGDERTAIEHDPQTLAPPDWLAGHLRRIRRVPQDKIGDFSLVDVFNNQTSEMVPFQTVVPFHAVLEPVYGALDALSTDRRVRPLLLAARAHVRRIAAALAVWANPETPVVTPEIMAWTGEYVVARMQEIVEQFKVLNSQDGKSSVYDQVLAKVVEEKSKGIATRELVITCWAFRSLNSENRGKLIVQMLDDEMVREVEFVNEKTKRRSKRLVATQFTKGAGP